MDDKITKFVAQHTKLVESERTYEMEQSQALVAGLRAAYLQKLGLALAGLRITQTRTGLGGSAVLTAEASVAGDNLAPTTLRVGDIVGVQSATEEKPGSAKPANTTNKQHSGVVWSISDSTLKISLKADTQIPAEWNERCSVIKLANDTTFKRITHALRDLQACAQRPALHRVLFGDEAPMFAKAAEPEFLDASLNASQRQAVARALAAEEIALVHGPPGTGKTHTVVELVRQLVLRDKRVLVCGPSNVSVDNLVERLARARDVRLVRLGHPARILPGAAGHSLSSQTTYSDQGALLRDVRGELDAALARVSKCKRASERRELYAQIKALRQEYRRREAIVVKQTVAGAQVVLATLSGAASRDLARSSAQFDVVIIDEATQAIEGECWIAALQAPKLVLAGDHHQLPPTVKSRSAAQLLETTMFERVRCMLGESVCCMLATQYRMHADIMRVSADRLYDGLLVADPSVSAHVLSDLPDIADTDDTRVALVFIDTADAAMLESVDDADPRAMLADRDSKLNRGEADLAVEHVMRLLDAGVQQSDIAVISPYNAQVRLLKSLLRDAYPAIEVGSVDGFQGREKEAVVLSLVRSNDAQEIGFLADYRRINVAVTRARRHLCVIADSQTVAMRDPFLKALVAHLEEAADLRYP